jgi:PAS domain S-box-containing protein
LVIKDLIFQIQDICNLKNKNKIIDKVAIISKTDLSGNITFANDIFCQVSGYTKEELIGANQRIVRHPEMSKLIFDELWDTLRAGKGWKGKIKNRSKDGETYIVNATIFPIFNDTSDTIIEYMAVRFLITEEELEKRQFQKNVIDNIQKQKQKEKNLSVKINDLEYQLKVLGQYNIIALQKALVAEKHKIKKLKNQVAHYEKELKIEKNKNSEFTQEIRHKRRDLSDANRLFRDTSSKHKYIVDNLQLNLSNQAIEIQKLYSTKEEQSKIIKDLKVLIEEKKS